jgi:hypothetical protein
MRNPSASWTVEVPVRHSAAAVLAALRDHPGAVAAAMSEPCGVEVLDRTVDGDRVRQVARWSVRRDAPALLRRWLPDGRLSWLDDSAWDSRLGTCTWSTDLPLGRDHLRVVGVDRYGPGSLVQEGTAVVTLASLPSVVGVPLAARVAALLRPLLESNLRDLLAAAERLLDRGTP